MVWVILGRFFRHCIHQAAAREAGLAWGHYDYMTDREISDSLHGRDHLINWTEVRRREDAGEKQSPWEKKAPGAI